MTGLRKNINLNDQIADVGFTFIECVFLSEFHNLLIFCFLYTLLYKNQFFITITSRYAGLREIEFI